MKEDWEKQESAGAPTLTRRGMPEVLSALQRKVREGDLERARAQVLTQRVTLHLTHRYRLLAVTTSVSSN